MLKEVDWSESRAYRSNDKHEPMEFYMLGLTNSTKFDLLLGYFNTSSINLLSLGFATFLHKGGTMRLVANHILSQKDKDIIIVAESGDVDSNLIDLSNIINLKNSLSDEGIHFFQCIAWLIANKKIEFVFVTPKNSQGISHFKSGKFHDGVDTVGFKASCNFTYSGIALNLEEIEVFLSWENSRSSKLINSQSEYFNKIFKKKANFVNYISPEDIEVAILSEFGDKEIDELLNQERTLIRKTLAFENNKVLINLLRKCEENIHLLSNTPKFPYSDGPREYQKEAYNNWVKNERKGMFAMATGTGKTITALNCLLNEYYKTKIYRAIITVPTTTLIEQWKEECAKFNFKNIITISSKENWNNSLSFFNTASKLIDTSYIVIVTYASLPRKKFQSYFKQLPKDTIFIADETHNLGSKGLLRLLPNIHLENRIGLSATPHRKFDEIGNETIQDFFNDKPPYIVSYTMEEALKIGWLCKYKYYPHIVKLTNQEMKLYKELSLQLLRMGLFDSKTGKFKSTPEIEMKLLERKRIIHKATNKVGVFNSILENEFNIKKNLKYTLIYVPEGSEINFDEIDYSIDTDEDQRLITKYTKAVSNTDDSIMVKQFTANSSNRENILRDFQEGRIHVLTSMKCLDEGVDVPRSELAIFCASTGNPRQFIQRRGRVLRLHNDKIHATIHDLVVIPEVDLDGSNFEMERNLVKRELERVVDFANLAMNKIDTYETLKYVLEYYKLNLNDF